MNDEPSQPHAHWSGYSAIDALDANRWRFTHSDRSDRPVTVEVTFPEGYKQSERFHLIAAIKHALDALPGG